MDIGGRKLMLVTIGTLRVNIDTEGAIESVGIIGMSVLNGLNLEKLYGLSFPRDKANCP